MMARKINLSLVVFIFFITACQKDYKKPALFKNSKNNGFNIFNLTRTGYVYQGKEIWAMNYPFPLLHLNFLRSNYLLTDGQRVDAIEINDNCKDDYIKGDYLILGDSDSSKFFCDIYLKPLMDFSLKVNDTLKVRAAWVRLDSKKFSRALNDTVFKFRRYLNIRLMEEDQTIISATRAIGIVGVYDTSLVYKDLKANPIGSTLKPNTIPLNQIKFNKPSMDLNIFKQFELDN